MDEQKAGNTGDSVNQPLFTDDDYQLVAEAAYREEERRELWEKLHGCAAPDDDQLDRLADLARRIGDCIKRLAAPQPGRPEP